MKRVHSSFMLDIIAAIPIRQLLNVVELDVQEREKWVMLIMPFIRLIKFHKVC